VCGERRRRRRVQAVEAASADEAVAILESRSDIALLFAEVQMPGSMDGLILARPVRNRWPAIKIILVSGRVELSEHDRPANSRFFQKPFATKQKVEGLKIGEHVYWEGRKAVSTCALGLPFK
jgi:two-component system, response regulator PdtaR